MTFWVPQAATPAYAFSPDISEVDLIMSAPQEGGRYQDEDGFPADDTLSSVSDNVLIEAGCWWYSQQEDLTGEYNDGEAWFNNVDNSYYRYTFRLSAVEPYTFTEDVALRVNDVALNGYKISDNLKMITGSIDYYAVRTVPSAYGEIQPSQDYAMCGEQIFLEQYTYEGLWLDHYEVTDALGNDVPVNLTQGGLGVYFYLPEYGGVYDPQAGTTRHADNSVQVNAVYKPEGTNIMYRLYFPGTHEHLYTADTYERSVLLTRGWEDEGIAWYAPQESSVPVYRLFNPYSTDHHYTKDLNEYNTLCKRGWQGEGIKWYSDENEGVPVYREFHPSLSVGSHNYTTDAYENKVLTTERGWKYEGIAWYGVAMPDTWVYG